MSDNVVLRLLLLVLLVMCSAILTGAEAAYFSLGRARLRRMTAKTDGAGAAPSLLIARPNDLLVTLLVGITLINIGAAAIAATLADHVFGERYGLVVEMIAMILLLTTFGEVLPMTIAVKYPEQFLRVVRYPVGWLATVLRPARAVLGAFIAAGLEPCVYADRPGVDFVVGERPATHPRHLARSLPLVAVDDLERVVEAEPVLTFSVVGRPAGLLEPVARALGGAGSASVVRDLVYGDHTLQVRPPGVSKWSGALAFCADQGLDPGRVLAVGDSANDLELLEAAKVACAVAGASPAVLARADYVLGRPGDGGWAAVLDLV
jgi:hypothetical protein